ncbi:MAG TPA: pilus assembly protein PilN [Thiothrix sp.]|nr:pilus assembly protein PilN [Thiothrix sp.]
MANFNLLPWREAQREQKKKQFFTAVIFAALIAVGLVFVAHLYMQDRINYQKSRNQYLKGEIRKLDQNIKEIKSLDETHQSLIDRIKVIETLQSTRPAIVHLFDEMAKALPQGMYIANIKQKNTIVIVEGKAESNARVSSYMHRLDASPWLKSSNLHIIATEKEKHDHNIRLKDFRLQVTQLLQHSKEKEQEAEKNQQKTTATQQNNNKAVNNAVRGQP